MSFLRRSKRSRCHVTTAAGSYWQQEGQIFAYGVPYGVMIRVPPRPPRFHCATFLGPWGWRFANYLGKEEDKHDKLPVTVL